MSVSCMGTTDPFHSCSQTLSFPLLTRAITQNVQPYNPKQRLGKMLGGEVPGQLFAQMSKCNAARAELAYRNTLQDFIEAESISSTARWDTDRYDRVY